MAVLERAVPAQGTAGTAQTTTIGEANHGGTVSSVSIIPAANVTANATNYRTISVVNKGQAGAGTAVVAVLALDTPTTDDLVAYDEKHLTLGAAGDLVLAEGDVLAAVETVTSAGLAHGGYIVKVVW